MDIVYISSIDWDFSWHRQQEMMDFLAKRGFRVLFVEPCSKKHPFSKRFIAEKENVWRLRPCGLPYERCLRSVHKLNSTISRREILRAAEQLRFCDPIIWLDRVHGFDYAFFQAEHFVIYDLIDEILAFGRVRNEKMLLTLENQVLQHADLLLSSSQTLLKRKLQQSGRKGKSLFIPNGVDCGRFQDILQKTSHQKPIIGFVGNISKRRLNYDVIQKVAQKRPGWIFKFVGPGSEEDRKNLQGLAPNIQVMPPVSGEKIPKIIEEFDIGMIPYNVEKKDMDYVFPRKACEYLAAGKPVISTPLSEVEVLHPYIQIAEDADEFENKIEQELHSKVTGAQRKKFAQYFDWTDLMEKVIQELSLVNKPHS